VSARRRRELEERVREDCDLVTGQRSVDAGQLQGLRHVHVLDARVRVRGADEVDVAHLVTLDVVEEDAFALQEPLVLLAWDVLARPAGRRLTRLRDDRLRRRDGGFRHPAAALIASTMFT
jgi:hypothetical protein